MMSKKLLSVAMGAVLAVSLCPAPAFASQLETGSVAKTASQQVSAQAKKKSVWVVTGKTTTRKDNSGKSVHKTKYAYNGKGLVSKRSEYYDSDTPFSQFEYTYSGNVVKKVRVRNSITSFTIKNNRVTKGTRSDGDGFPKVSTTYAYSSGRVSKCVSAVKYKKGSKWTTSGTSTYEYTRNKAGRCTKVRLTQKMPDGGGFSGMVYKYAYDKKGNIKTVSSDYETMYAYTNVYDKKGRLAKTVCKMMPSSSSYSMVWTTTYAYKKIAVNASAANKVSEQQWDVANCYDDTRGSSYFANFSFDGRTLY